MLKGIVAVLLIYYVFFGFYQPVNAEGKFNLPFKSPFSIFSDKDKENIQAPPHESGDLNVKIEETQRKLKPPVILKPDNALGLAHAQSAVEKAEFYIEEGDYESAKESLDSITDWIYDATEYHTDLYKTLSRLENSEVQANIERDIAIQFAVLRDKSLFLKSKVLIENGKKREAVEHLVEVVRSQPSTELGFKAYETLQQIGFTYKIEYEEEETK